MRAQTAGVEQRVRSEDAEKQNASLYRDSRGRKVPGGLNGIGTKDLNVVKC